MPTWLIIIIVAAVIMGAIGYFSSKDGERGENAAVGTCRCNRLWICNFPNILMGLGDIFGN